MIKKISLFVFVIFVLSIKGYAISSLEKCAVISLDTLSIEPNDYFYGNVSAVDSL